MPFCVTHGEKEKSFRFCPDCGAPLKDSEDNGAPVGAAGYTIADDHPADQNSDVQSQWSGEIREYPDAESDRQQIPRWQQIGIEMVFIPAGEFLCGDVKERVSLPEYGIAKTPVTNAQYQAFIQATGHRTPRYWYRGVIPQGKEHHPVVGLNDEDIQDFCAWLGLRIPTQREWEKAARGADGRDFPWGNQGPTATRCNFDGNVGGATPVGQYPTGASPYGLLDMAGNVWELCLDPDGQTHQPSIFRGGCWLSDINGVRTWSRGFGPVDGSDTTGFRCAKSP